MKVIKKSEKILKVIEDCAKWKEGVPENDILYFAKNDASAA